METLTARQRDILEFLRAFHAKYGYVPSYRQIGAEVGLRSVSSVGHQLRALERAGWIRLTPDLPRAIALLDPAAAT